MKLTTIFIGKLSWLKGEGATSPGQAASSTTQRGTSGPALSSSLGMTTAGAGGSLNQGCQSGKSDYIFHNVHNFCSYSSNFFTSGRQNERPGDMYSSVRTLTQMRTSRPLGNFLLRHRRHPEIQSPRQRAIATRVLDAWSSDPNSRASVIQRPGSGSPGVQV